MKIIITKDSDAAAEKAAQAIAKQIKKKPDSVLGLATGNTPLGLYERLVCLYKDKKINFSQVKTFNLDEYIGLGKKDKTGYAYYMNTNLFNHINIKKNNISLLDGKVKNIEKEAINYENKIKKSNGIDLQILGIGHNGHIGFNEPGTNKDSRTRIVKLTNNTRKFNQTNFGSLTKTPKAAITMGIGTILEAKKIILLATGQDKAEIVKKLIKGKITNRLPASYLKEHKDMILILDKQTAEKI